MYSFGTCVDDLYNHSWRDKVGSWLWVPKGEALAAVKSGQGFLAKHSEILRFSHNSRKIVKAVPRKILRKMDERSFAFVAVMDRSRNKNYHCRAVSRLGTELARGRAREEEDSRRYRDFEGDYRGRERGYQERDREESVRGYEGQHQGGRNWCSEYPRQDLSRFRTTNPQTQERDISGREEQGLRAKLKGDQDGRKVTDRVQNNYRGGESWENKGKGKAANSTDNHCFNCNQTGQFRKTA
jgi:hypothetical protein